MAGGKETPRQKMINLMYLVFIAMMALNMSKEVLSAFGMMNEKFESANVTAAKNNEVSLNELALRAEENSSRYAEPYQKAQDIKKVSDDFYNYIESLKLPIKEKYPIDEETNKMPYEQMEKGDVIDMDWFIADKYTDKGNEIISRFQKYINDVKTIVGPDVKYQFFIEDVEKRFSTADAETAWANVESSYQRRNDLIGNLVETVKGAAQHEQGTLTAVVEARAKATQVNVDPSNITPEQLAEFQQAQSDRKSVV